MHARFVVSIQIGRVTYNVAAAMMTAGVLTKLDADDSVEAATQLAAFGALCRKDV